VFSSTLPLNAAQSGAFIGAGAGSISTVASITGNSFDRSWISSFPWGIWRLNTAGTYAGLTFDQWQYKLSANNGNYYLDAEIMGDKWSTIPPMPPAVSSSVGKLHGVVRGSWVDMTPAVPQTGILIGETIGTFDPNALRWQAVAAGAFMETNAFLQMASTTAGQAKLLQLNIPAFEIGSVDFTGSGVVSADSINVTMAGVKYFAPTAGGRPTIWATGNISGTYTGNPMSVGNVSLAGSSATVSGLAPTLTMQNWNSGKWGAFVSDNAGTGNIGGNAGIRMFGKGAGSFSGGAFSGTAAGGVK
jgi:hypothetical protein